MSQRDPIVHDLKVWPPYFRRLWSGAKRAELRRNDRDFRLGDTLHLREWDPEAREYSGAWIDFKVTDVTAGEDFGLKEGYVMLSLSDRVDNTLQAAG